ncbi:unnamed protein product [Hydatigera taeniaeformis]|uniref:Uncharacterized protein n=1 Tax=Hydatigena taeniaeformis TaxID=6205 RepID=A0A0R3XAB1_HYDTA|nr:unnamed protein product [Hydatigera taeniaeformis]
MKPDPILLPPHGYQPSISPVLQQQQLERYSVFVIPIPTSSALVEPIIVNLSNSLHPPFLPITLKLNSPISAFLGEVRGKPSFPSLDDREMGMKLINPSLPFLYLLYPTRLKTLSVTHGPASPNTPLPLHFPKPKKQNMERRRRVCMSNKFSALYDLSVSLVGEKPLFNRGVIRRIATGSADLGFRVEKPAPNGDRFNIDGSAFPVIYTPCQQRGCRKKESVVGGVDNIISPPIDITVPPSSSGQLLKQPREPAPTLFIGAVDEVKLIALNTARQLNEVQNEGGQHESLVRLCQVCVSSQRLHVPTRPTDPKVGTPLGTSVGACVCVLRA